MFKLRLKGYSRDFYNYLRWRENAPKSFQLIHIDPCRIAYVLNDPIPRKKSGSVVDSDWDLDVSPVSELPKISACRSHFMHHVPWEQSGAWEIMAAMFETKRAPDNCNTWEDVQRRYARLDELYMYLKNGGRFKTQAELPRKNKFRERGGVHVHFNRFAEPVFGAGGCHRLAIAQILQLPSIPAQLGVVHKQAIAKWREQLTGATDAG